MSRWYIDTSAALKLLVEESESAALARIIAAEHPDLVACSLLETELRRAVTKYPGLGQSDVVALLDGVSMFDVPPSLFREAGLLPGEHLRSLDALHLAAALRLGVDMLVAYDHRLIASARVVGVPVISPR